MFHCLPNFSWADWNLAEVAVQLGKMVEHSNQSQPNPGLRADESPCTCTFIMAFRPLLAVFFEFPVSNEVDCACPSFARIILVLATSASVLRCSCRGRAGGTASATVEWSCMQPPDRCGLGAEEETLGAETDVRTRFKTDRISIWDGRRRGR